MGVLDQLFGGELSVAVRFIIAFGVVLALIAITFVALRRFAGRRLPLSNAAGGRARQPRLGVLDAFAIDARRRLVLIRRDNVEHLIMIGGPNDVLIESEIVRAPAQAALAPQRAPRAPGEATRAAVAPPQAASRPEPAPAASGRPAPQPEPEARPSAFRGAQRATPQPPAPPQPPAAPPASLAPKAPPRTARPEATPVAEEAPASAAKPKADADPLMADIERQLGEALARPSSAPTTARPASPAPQRRAPEPAPPPPAAKESVQQSHLDALEEEMASLLGRERP